MSKRPIELLKAAPLLDIASYARKGPGRRDQLSSTEVELLARTVNRTPEVMVKVLTRGGQDLRSVRRHLEYLDRKGELDLETDEGQRLAGKGVERGLLENWDLDLEEDRRRAALEVRPDRRPPKLVHKVLFSMPPGTPPQKVLDAVKNFAREEFGLKHRYAMVLHTDEPHPHVHMVIKAVSEQGERMNIRKATLRSWRLEFARHLRSLGVPANATERAVRGENRSPKADGLYRAEQRGQSTRAEMHAEQVRPDPSPDRFRGERGRKTLVKTRKDVERGWWAAGEILAAQGQKRLAAKVRSFVNSMPPIKSDREIDAERPFRQRDVQSREGHTR